ncbi:hypothetical protein [Shewanella algae]|uniref:hypothetical protein n=1 Tax=Shewanella algae TaxID=38313 RepID=UPI0010223BCE
MSLESAFRESLATSNQRHFSIYGVHVFDPSLEVETNDVTSEFRLKKPIALAVKVSVLCFYKSSFVLITINASGAIVPSESGVIDSEVVLSYFGREHNKEAYHG